MGAVLRLTIQEGIPVARFRAVAPRNGREVILGVSTTTLGWAEGQRSSVTALFQDISGAERVEALSRRAERLEAVAELSASMAHEIKNPLASIRSAVELIAGGRLDDADRSSLERLVVTESDRLSRLLSQFLDFGGLRVGKQEVLDIRDLARDLVALVERSPERPAGVTLELLPGNDPLPVYGDRDLLHRAVLNLVLNAIQFAGPDGKVTIALKERTGGGRRGRAGVRLFVRDTGPGLEEGDLPRIFDPFYTRRPGGHGLGLAVVHRAVVAHGGTVVARNLPGGGAEFAVDLPKAYESSDAGEEQG
jgi:signal transduction histidine kinase